MNKHWTIGLVAALSLIAASAALGVIDRGIQFSQDTSTSYITSDSAAKHLHTPPSGAAAPVVSACGTGPTITGNDFAGTFTTGTVTTTCTITFAVAYPAAPRCFVVPQGQATYPTYTTSTTAMTFTVDAVTTSYFYLCLGQ